MQTDRSSAKAHSLVVRFARNEHVTPLDHSRRARRSQIGTPADDKGRDMHKFGAGERTVRGAMLALLVMAIAACGGEEGSSASTTPASDSTPPPPANPEPGAGARAATLEWLAPSTATDGSTLTDLAGYRIYYGADVAQLTQEIEINNPGVLSYVVEDLAPGTYYFAVTAFTSKGYESDRSNAGLKEIS